MTWRIPSRLQACMPQMIALGAAMSVDADVARTARHRQLFSFCDSRTRIYLDTNWWSRIRKARFEPTAPPEDKRVLDLLHHLIDIERIICLSSGPCMEELLRQDDRYSRLATASTMDCLSCGLSYGSKEQQAIFELSEWMAGQFEDCPTVNPARESLVTCPAYNILYPRVSVRSACPDVDRIFPLHLDNICFAMTHCEALAVWDQWSEDPALPDRVANDMNSNLRITKEPHSHFAQVFEEEALGYLRAYWPHLCKASGSDRKTESTFHGHALADAIERLRILIAQPKSEGKLPPAMCVIAAGYAVIRTSPKRRFKKGDWHDLNHAAIALNYANLFLTEKSLHHLVSNRPFTDRVRHQVQVASTSADVIELLSSLEGS